MSTAYLRAHASPFCCAYETLNGFEPHSMVEKDRRCREVKEIKFIFREGFKDTEQFVNAELEFISPYLKKIIRAFYDLNWPEEEELDENLPEVQFTIPFRRGMLTGGPLARVFEFEFYTDTDEVFWLHVNEWNVQDMEESVATAARLKFSDWLALS